MALSEAKQAAAAEALEGKLFRWEDIPPERMNTHIDRQFVVGTDTMLARIVLRKGAHVPRHAHHNEQISIIMTGALRFVLPDREVVVRSGEMLCLPPNLPHEAFALEDTVNLDVFNPPRQDWIAGDDAYLRGEASKDGD